MKYTAPEIEIIKLATVDVIQASTVPPKDEELPPGEDGLPYA